jgi:hypothetical protein
MAVVFVTATGMSMLRWSEDAYLFVLGSAAFGAACMGFAARRRRWRGWTAGHIVGMSVSYIVLLTAFYVDNAPRLPLWRALPPLAFWIVPSLIGLPIMARALARHTQVRQDLHAMLQMTRVQVREPAEARPSSRV